jgi:hypothetical protein
MPDEGHLYQSDCSLTLTLSLGEREIVCRSGGLLIFLSVLRGKVFL